MNYRLNLGLHYKTPFESYYSIARRFIIANDRIPWTELKHELYQQIDVSKTSENSVVGNIIYLETGKSPRDPRVTFQAKNACPKCSIQLFHTQLYNYEWLTSCPIHNCKLLCKCPKCGLPWPNLNELGSRRCLVCARTNILERFKAKLLALPELDYKPIFDLYKIIEERNNSNLLANKSDYFPRGWDSIVEIDHPFFISFQSKYLYHSKNKKIKKQLNKYKIDQPSVYLKKAQLHPSNYQQKDDCLAMMRNELLGVRASAFSKLLQELKRFSFKHHEPTIYSYTDFSVDKIDNACPFCMALSMWYFNVQSYPYESRYKFNMDDYLSLRLLVGPHNFYEPKAITNFFEDKVIYQTDKEFILWSYKRSLEICFIDILEMCLLITSHTDDYSHFYNIQEQLYKKKKCLDYFFFQKKEMLFFYYTVKDPLSLIFNSSIDQKYNITDCKVTAPFTYLDKYSFLENCYAYSKSVRAYESLEKKFLRYIFVDAETEERKINDWYEKKKFQYNNSRAQLELGF